MADWLTYSLSDFLLFSPRTYYRLVEIHNRALWPAQVVAPLLGLGLLGAAWRDGERAGRVAAAVLAACWLWVGWAYLLQRYATINWAAGYLAAGFAVEAALLAWLASKGGLAGRDKAGASMVAFALVLQPLVAPLQGRSWTQAEVFGVAPDPTVVATLGFLLMPGRVPWALLVIPTAWCAINGATLWTMGSPEAAVPVAAALLAWVIAAAKAHQ